MVTYWYVAYQVLTSSGFPMEEAHLKALKFSEQKCRLVFPASMKIGKILFVFQIHGIMHSDFLTFGGNIFRRRIPISPLIWFHEISSNISVRWIISSFNKCGCKTPPKNPREQPIIVFYLHLELLSLGLVSFLGTMLQCSWKLTWFRL